MPHYHTRRVTNEIKNRKKKAWFRYFVVNSTDESQPVSIVNEPMSTNETKTKLNHGMQVQGFTYQGETACIPSN